MTKKPAFRKQHGIVRNFEFNPSYMTLSLNFVNKKTIGVSSKTDELLFPQEA